MRVYLSTSGRKLIGCTVHECTTRAIYVGMLYNYMDYRYLAP